MRIVPIRTHSLRRTVLLIAAAASCSPPFAATAQDRGFQEHWCRSYARTAADQAKRNHYSNCGGTGARWDINAGNHLGWCAALPDEDGTGEYMSIAGRETRARKALLSRCKAVGVAPVPFGNKNKPGKSNTKADAEGCGSGWYESGGECYPKLN